MARLGPLSRLFGFLSHDIAIDLGTANTLVMVRGRGIVIIEPSIVAIDRTSKRILSIGEEAQRMVGRTPANIVAVRPLRDGVISDFEVTERMLSYFIRAVQDRSFLAQPRVVVGIPSGVTEVEKRAVHDAALSAGARSCFLIEEPLAAAIGSGLPVMEASGCMVVSRSIRVAGDEMDRSIVAYARQVHNLLIGERTAEEVKKAAGSASPLDTEESVTLRGRDQATGLPKAVEVSTIELRDALAGSVGQIVEAVRSSIEITPPELVSDLMAHGIALAGGGALLRGLDRRISQETRFPVYVSEDPLLCVVRGAGAIFDEIAASSTVEQQFDSGRARR